MSSASSMFKATSAQDPNLLGSTALEMAVQLRAGETLENDTILVPSSIVNSENLATYEGWV
jgi:ribose transport system substrate-binding protein